MSIKLKELSHIDNLIIPINLFKINSITNTDIILLAWIQFFFSKDIGGCDASNSHLALKLRVKENTVVKSLTKLRRLGLIEDISFDGRFRVINAKINPIDSLESYR